MNIYMYEWNLNLGIEGGGGGFKKKCQNWHFPIGSFWYKKKSFWYKKKDDKN